MNSAATTARPRRPVGGFRMISTRQLCAAWTAYRTGHLGGFLAFRVYLALHEIAERRAAALRRRGGALTATRSVTPPMRSVLPELQQLVGGAGGRCLRRALRRLAGAGLIRCDAHAIVLTDDPIAVPSPMQEPALRMLASIHPRTPVHDRTLALPRRLVRFLARPGCPAVAATLLGHAFRCLWRRGRDQRMAGSCSAEFVARVFGVHVRTVKAARGKLQADGWLRSIPAPRWHVHRYGGRWAISPQSTCRAGSLRASAGTESPLPAAVFGTESPPPESQRSLSSRVQQPDAAPRRLVAGPGERRARAADLRDVRAADLRDDARLASLLRQAIQRGWLTDGEADRLRGFAAAEHALRVGRRNPAGLFVWMLRRRCWHFISAVDEDRARARLRHLETQVPVVSPAQSQADAGRLAALVDRTACALALTNRLEREKASTASASPAKKIAVASSPQCAASSLTACMASTRNSTFSASVARNTAGSNGSQVVNDVCESIRRACHTLAAPSRGFHTHGPLPPARRAG